MSHLICIISANVNAYPSMNGGVIESISLTHLLHFQCTFLDKVVQDGGHTLGHYFPSSRHLVLVVRLLQMIHLCS